MHCSHQSAMYDHCPTTQQRIFAIEPMGQGGSPPWAWRGLPPCRCWMYCSRVYRKRLILCESRAFFFVRRFLTVKLHLLARRFLTPSVSSQFQVHFEGRQNLFLSLSLGRHPFPFSLGRSLHNRKKKSPTKNTPRAKKQNLFLNGATPSRETTTGTKTPQRTNKSNQ